MARLLLVALLITGCSSPGDDGAVVPGGGGGGFDAVFPSGDAAGGADLATSDAGGPVADPGAGVPDPGAAAVDPGPPPPPDQDGDGIPDDADPFPTNGQLPGVAAPSTVYANTATELYTLGIKTYSVHLVAAFGWPSDGGGHQMTDIAIDRHGILWGVTFDRLYVCHPQTAECFFVATLPDSFNGLTMVPGPLLGEGDTEDVLVGLSQDGGWWRLDIDGVVVTPSKLGSFGGGWGSSGDAYSIEGIGTFVAADQSSTADDVLLTLDPATGQAVGQVAPLTGYRGVFGLAGWTERAFAFEDGGDILVIHIETGEVDVLAQTGKVWWGAGVRTRITPD